MRADFTPSMGSYHKQNAFKYWVQKVLPLVYDDSLSYYELLAKVVDYLNNTIEDVNQVIKDTENLHDAYAKLEAWCNEFSEGLTNDWNEFRTFVTTYLQNLDVQEEINTKLDVMAEDGTLTKLFKPFLESAVALQNQKIAVLESRMNTFAKLPDGSLSTSADAELVDVRVGFNGVTYADAGTSVRKQTNMLKYDAKNIFQISNTGRGTLPYSFFGTWINGFVNGSNGKVDTTAVRRCCMRDIASFSYNISLEVSEGFMLTCTYYNNGTFSYTDFNLTSTYVIPANSSFRLTIRRVTEDMSEVADIEEFISAISLTSDAFEELRSMIQSNSDKINDIAVWSTNKNMIPWNRIALNSYIANNGTVETNNAYWSSDYIEVSADSDYVFSNATTLVNVFLGKVVFFTSGKTVISNVVDVYTFHTPENCKYIRVSRQYWSKQGQGANAGITADNYLTDDFVINHCNLQPGTSGSFEEPDRIILNTQESFYQLTDKKCYAIGDSFIAQGYVTSALVRKTGLALTNYGIGGTRLADADGTYTNAICNRISAMSEELPDLILVEGGSNDCGASTGTPLGEVGVSQDNTTLAGAVYSIVSQLSAKYPGVPIVFSTMPYRWLDGQRWKDYAMTVKRECEYLGIPCLNAWTECGFNEFNQGAYNLNGDGIHVNADGGERFAQAWLSYINNAVY